MIIMILIFCFGVAYAMSTQNNIDSHYNVESFSEMEREAIVVRYYTERPKEGQAFIKAKPHIKAKMIVKIMEGVEAGMERNPAKWWKVKSGKTIS